MSDSLQLCSTPFLELPERHSPRGPCCHMLGRLRLHKAICACQRFAQQHTYESSYASLQILKTFIRTHNAPVVTESRPLDTGSGGKPRLGPA